MVNTEVHLYFKFHFEIIDESWRASLFFAVQLSPLRRSHLHKDGFEFKLNCDFGWLVSKNISFFLTGVLLKPTADTAPDYLHLLIHH